jgi:hypothetical protein
MPKRIGLVVGKDFGPMPGETSGDWCHLTIDLSEEERISVLASPGQGAKVDVGDVVRFRPPKRQNRPVRSITRLASDPSLLPLPEPRTTEVSSEGPT